jgi:hypothetical protein
LVCQGFFTPSDLTRIPRQRLVPAWKYNLDGLKKSFKGRVIVGSQSSDLLNYTLCFSWKKAADSIGQNGAAWIFYIAITECDG